MGDKFKAVSAGKPILVKNGKLSTVKYVEAVIFKETMDMVLLSVVTEAFEYKIIIKSEATKRR